MRVSIGTSAASAFQAFRRPPVAVLPASDGSGSTPASSALRTWVTVADGLSENSRPAVPVTCGVAIEVPASRRYSPLQFKPMLSRMALAPSLPAIPLWNANRSTTWRAPATPGAGRRRR